MCGIAGAIGAIDSVLESFVRVMAERQAHRGPDDSGFYSSGAGSGAAFGFRRLAIIDLTESGHQPMLDPERDNVLVFNGEIYNHTELRAELEGLGERFRSASDSEVILRGYARWGTDVVRRLRGMFAFAIYDPRKRSVFLARDRLGIKPLYFAEITRPGGRSVLFASELRSILATGAVEKRLNPAALATYLWNGFVVGPDTMVDGISLLAPGTTALVDVDAPRVVVERYWSLETLRTAPDATRAQLEESLLSAARQHLMSDVPLGVFLSGGIDSSAVTAMAVRASGAKVKTFHVGFEEVAFDESKYARAVADALGTEHHEFRLTQRRFHDDLEGALASLDQPTFDGINTYFVSRVVRDAGFTVALAGTGGDELFGGYRSFRDVPRASMVARAASFMPETLLRACFRGVDRLRMKPGLAPPQTRFAKLGDLLLSGGDRLVAYQTAYALFTRDFRSAIATLPVMQLAPYGLSPERARELSRAAEGASAESAVALFELALFLGERLLRDSDAASMGASLELRVPLLDHQVIEAACALPDSLRFRPLGKKQLLRSLALTSVPPEIFDRPKAGFVLPIEVWAKDRLADEITTTFANRSLLASVGMNAEALEKLFRSFRTGEKGIYWSRVWAPYVLLRWCQRHGVALG